MAAITPIRDQDPRNSRCGPGDRTRGGYLVDTLANVIDSDAERWVAEPPKFNRSVPGPLAQERSPFERDRGRVLHSAGFRRLATKTQVHTAGEDGFLRTRLTHSLEVAQIARELRVRLGCAPDVVR